MQPKSDTSSSFLDLYQNICVERPPPITLTTNNSISNGVSKIIMSWCTSWEEGNTQKFMKGAIPKTTKSV